jgi:hypothetical protein
MSGKERRMPAASVSVSVTVVSRRPRDRAAGSTPEPPSMPFPPSAAARGARGVWWWRAGGGRGPFRSRIAACQRSPARTLACRRSPALSGTRRAATITRCSTSVSLLLFADMALAYGDGRYARQMRTLGKPTLSITERRHSRESGIDCLSCCNVAGDTSSSPCALLQIMAPW